MRAKTVCTLAAFILATLPSRSLAQQDETRPADLPSDRNIVAFSQRADGAMLADVRKAKPLIEAYLQLVVPDGRRGFALAGDRVFLGRFNGSGQPTMEGLLESGKAPRGADTAAAAGEQQVLDGLASLMVPDWKQLGPERYEYTLVGRIFLGAVRCVVFDVRPLNDPDGFTGRIYLEDQYWNLVRFTGMNARTDAMLSALRGKSSRFRVDSWRMSAQGHRWMPAYAYIEEVTAIDAPESPLWKGQVRFWGYDAKAMHQQRQFAGLRLEESPATTDGPSREWPTPQRSQRLLEQDAEQHILNRLIDAGVMGATGDVERDCEQVLTNLIVTSDLVLASPPRCRILLTTPLEAFIVGTTIVVSRSVIDLAPDESGVALVLAHQLAHHALGDRNVDTKYAFPDILRITDSELLARLRFRHSPSEEAAADAKAIEILEKSPYASAMSGGGLFLQALRARGRSLPHLIAPQFGEHIVDVEHVMEHNTMFRVMPEYDTADENQAPGALPLGSKLVVNPFDGSLALLRSEPIPVPARRERAELAVLPFRPFLDYAHEKDQARETSARSR